MTIIRYRIMLIALLSIGTVSAQTDHRLDASSIPYVDASFEIDGRMDEAEWSRALIVPLSFETDPRENLPALVHTDAYLIDTGDALLVGFVAEDPEPDQIRAFLRDRDSAYQDDFVGVVLDTYNDERRALEFFSNPLGSQMDLIQDDVNGSEDDSWNAIWDSAGQITDTGFVVEMELPYSQMPMADIDGEKTWGIGLIRKYPRDLRYSLSNRPRNRNIDCGLCQLDKFTGFANADQGRDLEITPTLVTIASQSREHVTDPRLSATEVEFEPGLDVNWGITPNITFNGTINPDFSQVEADVAQLDVNNTFALFFPERRSFFLENADLFSTPIRAVFTRNVADPDYGVRLVGKTDVHNYGFFHAEDTVTNLVVPGVFGSSIASLDQDSSNTVLRYRRDVLDNSTVGLLYTRRQSDDYSNQVAGVDARIRLSDASTLTAQYLDTDTDYPDRIVTDFDQLPSVDGGALSARYTYDTRDWYTTLIYEEFDDGFRSDLGFINQIGYDKWIAGGARRWIGGEDDWYSRIQIYSDWDITHDQQGRVLERELESNISVNGPMQSYVELYAGKRDRLFDDILFDEKYVGLYGEFQPTGGLELAMNVNVSDQIDFANSALGDQLRLEPRIEWNLGRHWSLRLRHNYTRLQRQSQDVFTANQTDLRMGYQFDLRQRLRLTVQYTDVDRNPALHNGEINAEFSRLSTQLIYSYKVNPRTVLFVGYSDSGVDTDDVSSMVRTNKTLFAKWSIAWTPG